MNKRIVNFGYFQGNSIGSFKQKKGGVEIMAHSSIDDLKKRILPMREQVRITDSWLEYRLKHVLPALMEREAIDLWVIIAREYNEDPVVLSLMPGVMLSARRRTILVFHRQGDTVQCLHFGKADPALNTLYTQAWDKEKEGQWEALGRYINEHKPGRIGVNMSDTFALADGLSKSQYEMCIQALDSRCADRVHSAEKLAIAWLETRTPREIEVYEGINDLVHAIIAKAYSREVIHPGITTALDVAWWIRQTIIDIGLQAWFQPTISVQRHGQEKVEGNTPILPGDMLHCDVGLHYLGLATDTQQMAYVLKRGESSPPAELQQALARGNRLQDIFTQNFVEGNTGNEIFTTSLQEAQEEGIKAMIYTHPIGFHGHGAGPTMGLFDQQSPVPVQGDYPLYENTCYAIELNSKENLPIWDEQEIMIALEQTAVFTEGKVHYFAGRQTAFHCI